MESLINAITEKTGISEEHAKTAIQTVVSFLKDKMPVAIGNQVEMYVKGGNNSTDDMAAKLKDNITGAFGL